MIGLITNIRVGHKVWLGFSISMALLIVISVSTLLSLAGVKSEVDQVVQSRQPTVMLTKDLATRLNRMASALGFDS